MAMNWAEWLQGQWYEPRPAKGLVPLSLLFRGAVALRHLAYRKAWKKSHRLPVPVIVVGNLTVGGTGKTPLTIWLAEFLLEAGYKPGIVSRGYGGHKRNKPFAVFADSDAADAGDEPVLIARRTGCPVYVFPRRAEAGRALLAETACDIIIADDGLQHYALARDVEIAVVDGERRFGNGQCLPAGPLREPQGRLAGVDFVVCRGAALDHEYPLSLSLEDAVNQADATLSKPLADFAGIQPLFAIAGVGHPGRFFADLRRAGLSFEERAFPDHHPFTPEDLNFGDHATILMTEKDAVKCRGFASTRFWTVPLRGCMPPAFGDRLLQRLKGMHDGQKTA
jgi:tetraacyldisaccharide 4'-kinase